MKIVPFSCLVFTAFLFSACQKEIIADFLEPVTNPLLGTWEFTNVHGNSSSTVDITAEGSEVMTNTEAEYISEHNQGTYTFSDSTVTADGIAYDFSTTAHSYTYENGNLDDSTSFPFNFSLPATSGTTNYKLVGNDSLTTDAALIPQAAGAPTNTPSDPLGYRFTVVGDTLTVSADVEQSILDNSQGVPIVSNTKVTVISTMVKKP